MDGDDKSDLGEPSSEHSALNARSRKRSRRAANCLPCRPLSAYNFFFKEERERLINEAEAVTLAAENPPMAKSGPRSSPVQTGVSVEKQHHSGQNDGGNSAAVIGRRWKELSEGKKEKYKELAARDMQRYRKEMDEYHQQLLLDTSEGAAKRIQALKAERGEREYNMGGDHTLLSNANTAWEHRYDARHASLRSTIDYPDRIRAFASFSDGRSTTDLRSDDTLLPSNKPPPSAQINPNTGRQGDSQGTTQRMDQSLERLSALVYQDHVHAASLFVDRQRNDASPSYNNRLADSLAMASLMQHSERGEQRKIRAVEKSPLINPSVAKQLAAMQQRAQAEETQQLLDSWESPMTNPWSPSDYLLLRRLQAEQRQMLTGAAAQDASRKLSSNDLNWLSGGDTSSWYRDTEMLRLTNRLCLERDASRQFLMRSALASMGHAVSPPHQSTQQVHQTRPTQVAGDQVRSFMRQLDTNPYAVLSEGTPADMSARALSLTSPLSHTSPWSEHRHRASVHSAEYRPATLLQLQASLEQMRQLQESLDVYAGSTSMLHGAQNQRLDLTSAAASIHSLHAATGMSTNSYLERSTDNHDINNDDGVEDMTARGRNSQVQRHKQEPGPL